MICCPGWPRVLPEDCPEGLTHCHCGSAVWTPHHTSCTLIHKLVHYDVFTTGRHAHVGTLQMFEPYDQDEAICNLLRNDAAWCVDTVLDEIVWLDDVTLIQVQQAMDHNCSCGLLSFEFRRVVDAGPFIHRIRSS